MPGDVGGNGAVSSEDDRGMVGRMPSAIVTGGNSGIGRATAVALARAGFDVGITWHRDEDRAESLRAEIGDAARFEAV